MSITKRSLIRIGVAPVLTLGIAYAAANFHPQLTGCHNLLLNLGEQKLESLQQNQQYNVEFITELEAAYSASKTAFNTVGQGTPSLASLEADIELLHLVNTHPRTFKCEVARDQQCRKELKADAEIQLQMLRQMSPAL